MVQNFRTFTVNPDHWSGFAIFAISFLVRLQNWLVRIIGYSWLEVMCQNILGNYGNKV